MLWKGLEEIFVWKVVPRGEDRTGGLKTFQ